MSETFNPNCVCGGSVDRPNDDCERCRMQAALAAANSEVELLRKAWTDARNGLLDMEKDCKSNFFTSPLDLIHCCIELMDSIATIEDNPDAK